MMPKSVEDLLNGKEIWVASSLHTILNAIEEVDLYRAETNAAVLARGLFILSGHLGLSFQR